MAKKILHICDKCGHTQDAYPPAMGRENSASDFLSGKLRFFFYVGIYCGSDNPKPYGGGLSIHRSHHSHVAHTQYWCGQCAVAAGIRLPQLQEPAPAAPPTPTLDSMVQEIVQNAIQEAKDN